MLRLPCRKNKLRALYGKWIEGLYSYDMHTWDTYTALKAQGQDVELPPTTPGEVSHFSESLYIIHGLTK